MSSYFGQSDREGADVLAFLSLHSSSNILNLCLSYLRQLAVKWATLWPSELKRLYCRIFSTVSKHFIGGRFNIYAERIEDSANAGAVGNARTNESDAGARDVVDIMRTNTLVLVLFGELILNDCIERAEFGVVEQDVVFPSLFFQGNYVIKDYAYYIANFEHVMVHIACIFWLFSCAYNPMSSN
jgi:hypothetical protein